MSSITVLLNIDFEVLIFLQEYIRNDILTAFFKVITALGNGGWLWIVLSILFLFNKKTRSVGITAIIALIIGALITNVCLKNLIARVRPYDMYAEIIRLIEIQKDFSFPSGHSCSSFAAGWVYYKRLPKKIGIPLLTLSACIAFSRLYVGVHYPSDVIAGILIGILAAELALKIYNKISKKRIETLMRYTDI